MLAAQRLAWIYRVEHHVCRLTVAESLGQGVKLFRLDSKPHNHHLV